MFTALCCLALVSPAAEPDGPSPGEIFTRRIVPLVQSSRASSCTECHFGGVDLRQYVLDDAAQTFAALRSAGLIDVEHPDRSKLLAFIGRKPEKPDPLLAKVREEEYAAFRLWIDAAVHDPATLAVAAPAKPVGSSLPVEVVRHARHDRVLQSFVENVWVDVERCIGCHSPDRNQRQVKQHGEHISWISPGDPAGTLAIVIEHDLIDVDVPEKSLLLTKPLGLVEHVGHKKFPVGSRSDKSFRRFLADYAAIVKGDYRTAADLPPTPDEFIVATGQQLRITDLPERARGLAIRVDIHSWHDGWSARPVAVSDGMVNDKQLWQNPVFAVVRRDAAGASSRLAATRQLPPGRYQARIFIDRENHIAKDRDYVLGPNDYFGSVEFDGPWRPGYQPPKTVSAAEVRAGQ